MFQSLFEFALSRFDFAIVRPRTLNYAPNEAERESETVCSYFNEMTTATTVKRALMVVSSVTDVI